MNQINLLIVDDDKVAVDRAINHLKRHDTGKILGECVVDDSFLALEKVEDYHPSTYGIEFHAVLIDYQLNKEFTGTLISAWLMLQLRIPRLTLTTATYSGPHNYFDEFIRKDEITDSPTDVINKIQHCIETFNYSNWLDNQYRTLSEEYKQLLLQSEKNILGPADLSKLASLENVLDKFEKILDTQQEEKIKEKLAYLEQKETFAEVEQEHEQKMQMMRERLNVLLSDLGKPND